ncbi:type II toxin-antitoxin system RelE/ParE family toxin [Hymenobacter siberiensis]|jgi:toxin ParE1/3/4|uniref:type II toxin-antitoxin system RelE/ParE family toxin n=1 Tax=Hymenobacter siberiensis TaxID=2848396 RepID=UPI001C1E734C|nr:type II toxin-antitoxin system RelE/ParE family toxin [Hymenobacter siberiensis]MBU6120822.1 type II toxin-antitoxin system RelE/ParE family toxin [Hymenobacter siberiensis]
MVQIRWSRRIITEIHEARDYLHAFSPRSAERLTDAVFGKAALLESQPLLGRVVPEAEGPDVRELFYQKYRLNYRVVSQTEILMLTLHPSLRPLTAGSLLE